MHVFHWSDNHFSFFLLYPETRCKSEPAEKEIQGKGPSLFGIACHPRIKNFNQMSVSNWNDGLSSLVWRLGLFFVSGLVFFFFGLCCFFPPYPIILLHKGRGLPLDKMCQAPLYLSIILLCCWARCVLVLHSMCASLHQ